jgi:GR25 family glycosyltransferase involved in LPS biosynthesis
MNLHKVVISLEKRQDRLKIFKNNCPFNDVNILHGFDGSKLELEQDKHKANQLKNLSKGEIGCFISHIRCYEYMIKNNIDNMLIFEDDCNFCDNFIEKLNSIYNEYDEYKKNNLIANNIIYIGGRFTQNYITNINNCLQISNNIIQHNLYDNKNDNMNVRFDLDRTTHSYIISKSTALFLLKIFYKNITDRPVDHWLIECFNKFKYNIYSTQPLLCYSPLVGDSDIR